MEFLVALLSLALVVSVISCMYTRKMLKTTLNAADAAIFLVRGGKKIVYANATASHFSLEEILQKHAVLIAHCLKEGKKKCEAFVQEEPSYISYEITVSPSLKKKELVITIKERSTEEKMEVMGKNFIANASHELRTPITIIKGFAEMLHEMPEISADMLEGIVEKIIRNCNRMSNLVKSLITLADLDNKTVKDREKIDLISLLDGCHYTLLSVHPEVGIELLHNVSYVEVEGSRELLELCFMNILENGVKYSEKPAKIITTIQQTEKMVSVSIKDFGKGIPKEDLPYIFQRFYTVNKAHSRKLGGAGLGLSIVRKICSIHGIDVQIDSSERNGTTFTFVFPQ